MAPRLQKLTPRAILALLMALAPVAAWAQNITTDGTLGPKSVPLTGPNYTVGANLGRQVGGNLFQSFGRFGLATGERATFTGPPTVTDIIARVTGGSASSIDGLVRSTIAGANLFLINPFGIVFGPGATLNVSGSFHASTVDYLKLADGAKFQATAPNGSTLSAAPPSAFGFVSASPAAIAVNGSTLKAPGLGLIGGPVTIAGASLISPGGMIRIASAAGPGEILLDPTQAASLTNFGPVTISAGARLDATGGGSVFIHADTLSVETADIDADNAGSGAGGRLVLQADSGLALTGGASVHASNRGAGSGGAVMIQTGGALVVIDASIAADTVGAGNAGRISILAGSLTIAGDGRISSDTFGSGNAGGVIVQVAGQLTIAASRITSQAAPMSAGSAGNVAVTAGNIAVLANGAINAATFGTGSGGNVTVTAGQLTIDGTGGNTQLLTGISAGSQGAGDAGNIRVRATQVSIAGGGTIASDAFGKGQGGTISIEATNLSIAGGGAISSEAKGRGDGGNISVEVGGTLVITASAADPNHPTAITAQGGPESSGAGGHIRVSAGAVVLAGPAAAITSQSLGTGKAGAITMTSGSLELSDGAAISTAAATAKGGDIALAIGNLLYLQDGRITTAGTVGSGGNITLDPVHIVLRDGSVIDASGGIDGGNIQIRANAFIPEFGSLVTATGRTGISGTVSITGQQLGLSGSLIVLPGDLRAPAAVLADACTGRGVRLRASLYAGGAAGVPPDLDLPIGALYLGGHDRGHETAHSTMLQLAERLPQRCE